MLKQPKFPLWIAAVLLGATALVGDGCGNDLELQPKKFKGVWTDPGDPNLPPDFVFQGEYVGGMGDAVQYGCQVIALGNGYFQAVVLPGGLPGAGWDGKAKILMDGRLADGVVEFKPAGGQRRYLAQKPLEFCATSVFPPPGHKDCVAFIQKRDAEYLMLSKPDAGEPLVLRKTMRKSPTLGLEPPKEAFFLFDGTNVDEWTRGRIDKEAGTLNTDGKDILTKKEFMNYTMHLEFLLPYRPEGRGQGRGNSGFYQVHHYEVQILDSFGLEGKNNECGGIYTKKEPNVNLCLPPLVWQTYDVDFTNAVRDEAGKKVKNARLTLKHNGVVIHDDVEIDGPTGGHRNDPEGTPGPIMLQGHDNPLAFRNIWILEKK